MTSTMSSPYETPPPAYEDLDASTLPQSPTPNYMMTSTTTSSHEVSQQIYEDVDTSMPAVTDGSQVEVKVKPVPRPRSKVQRKEQCSNNNNNNTSDSVDKTTSTTNEASTPSNEYTPDFQRPHPVRPPPSPPVSKRMISSKPTAAPENQYVSSNTQPRVKPPVVRPEQTPNHPSRPERPPPPSIYYGTQASTSGRPFKSKTEECQNSTYSSIGSKQNPVYPSLPEEMSTLHGSQGETVTDSKDKPAVPPRPKQSLPSSHAVCEGSPTQGRTQQPPSLPTKPPPAPSEESLYSQIDDRLYLEILPDEDKTQGRSTLRSERHNQSSSFSLCQQTTEDSDDLNGMLRWLKKVSKPDYMSPSMYGLSIEEEIRSFHQRTMNVSKALRLFNLLMMKRNESLKNFITEFTSISDSLDKLQKKTKTMGIAGGTAGAVGGVTAVMGIALAPVTLGASLIATAVGAGMVASAGGMSVHTAKARKKIVNRMAVEKLVNEYQTNVVDLENCLDFILSGMNELRRHDIARLHRAGAKPEAVKMAHLSQSVFTRTSAAPTGGMASERLLLAFSEEMDQYFTERDGQKLKKLNKSKFSGRVRLLAKNLQDELENLNHMWEVFS
ncbi:uncharacterized protein LOC113155092 isoform X2 [Anabas testudineus]|uniref:uncharacterized protein LOC113155092 isoform X2 n=1 Tax=Anabas testudineus TaxID=64144 RepID=UPI000E45ECA5|nr:uncharacterized protein LOC113155092 isoform X2 [Anabas testudineus]